MLRGQKSAHRRRRHRFLQEKGVATWAWWLASWGQIIEHKCACVCDARVNLTRAEVTFASIASKIATS